LLSIPPVSQQKRLFGHLTHRRPNGVRIIRLGEEHAARRKHHVLRCKMSRSQDDFYGRPAVTNAGGKLHPIHASGHVDVRKDDLNVVAAFQNLDRLVGVAGFDRVWRGAMPAILPFLKGAAFGPKDIEAMSVALSDVCKALDIHGDAQAREVIAARIIELAVRGECSPTRLRDRVLAEASGNKDSL
jgi:hypothetical protein